jgi:hypothetical protein
MVELETVERISSESSLLGTAEYAFEIENTPMFVSDIPTRTEDEEKEGNRPKNTPEKHGKIGRRRERKGNRATSHRASWRSIRCVSNIP